ncbi:putative M23 family peptidase [Candidatus Azobacteroides pseudotrichonymphae genomovar. CFP2]|uniref:M23 family peptidase n=2 Tax=Candidatus Azobacteroides TaxID=511434 RepID=B6YRZ4_AZOPC|nr:putative M23 family peptidase [Candidatus Azobacteroides pseudotrichonymphae genomovar. CFP2]
MEIHARSYSERKLSAGIVVKQYPADELYEESWNTEFLKAYKNIPVPDSLVIDVSNFVMPVEGKVTSPYGPREYHGEHFHYGTDIKLQVGDTVRAAFEGKVRVRNYDPNGYGYYLVLRHPNGLETVYGHLSQFLVEQNQNVNAGEPIALGGCTGNAYGPHLHFEIRILCNAINPAEIIDFDKLCLKEDIYVYRKGQTEENLIEQESVKEEIEDVKPIDTPGVEEETEVLSEITEPDAAELCLLRKKEQIMKEVSDITLQWEQLISDENQYISELTILMGDLEESIGKMGSGKITCWNKELETINSRIGILNTKNGNIRYRRDKLKEKQTLIDSQLEGNPLLKEMVSMEYFFRLINEWNDLLKEANSKINTYNNIIAAFNSSVNHLNPSDNP